MWDPYAEFQSATLPNGLTLYAALWPGRPPWEVMGFLIHSGAEHDPSGLEGLSHFVEHLVCNNTKVTRKEISTFFKDRGGWVSLGHCNYACTYYKFFVPTNKTDLAGAFSIFGHMLLSAKIKKFIGEQRQIIINEFSQHYPSKLQYEIDMRKHKALYAGCWLERFAQPFGNPETVKRITQRNLQSYYDKHYTPANMSVVGVGGMMLSELVELLSESPFAINKKGVRTPLPAPVIDVAPPSETRYVFEMSKHITMTVPVETGAYVSIAKMPGNVNAQAIHILNNMFEVLNEEVRERRAWTYGIYTAVENFRHFYEFSISCPALLTLDKIEKVEKVIDDCVASMGDKDLFERAKRQALASNFMIDLTAENVCDGALADLANHQRIISLTEWNDNIEQVTMDDIHKLLRWLRPEQRWTFIRRP